MIVADTLRALDPAGLVAHTLSDHMDVMGWSAALAAEPVPGRTVLIAVGKAALRMARGAVDVLGRRFDEGIVLVPGPDLPTRPDWLPRHIRLRVGGHPVPDQKGEAAALEIAQLLSGLTAQDRLLTLISGGGSALLSLPVDGLTLQDLRAVTAVLLDSGLTIHEVNSVRRPLEVLKGGGMAALAAPAECLGLILSDVLGDDPAVVASGPLSPGGGTARDAEILLRRAELWHLMPDGVRRWLQEHRGAQPDQVTNDRVRVSVIGGGQDAAREAMSAARRRGVHTVAALGWPDRRGPSSGSRSGAGRCGGAGRARLTPSPRLSGGDRGDDRAGHGRRVGRPEPGGRTWRRPVPQRRGRGVGLFCGYGWR